ncbi:hypothetical protein [Sinanaerobacter chloroacetimidivorans]|jgi:hypothetical protein|uniref:Uncharacterized protein n=1 Tax=Sinanaerobacter chloroacetimidivorans TaxID=2818044 RepID=A0A8J7VZ56_9FIRM|nr:hypothetical protein [Sinanaerobacter chloroacetimidivorans]MBR0597779.1 hypothetical protein [Sinanaerobacter chloroacetimidivorans]
MISKAQQEVPFISYGHLNLIKDFRLLLTELAYLTRFYIVSVASDFGDSEALAQRLYNLPMKFLAKAELIFGTPLGEELVNLLSTHIISLQTLVNGLKIGDQASVDAAVQRLYSNADLLAAYFSRINPFWEEAQWRNLFYTYDRTVIDEAIAVMSGDYVRSLEIFDRLMLNALAMGDYLADGFIEYLTATRRQET